MRGRRLRGRRFREVGAGLLQTLAESDLVAPQVSVPAAASFTFGEPGSVTATATGDPAPTFGATGAPKGVEVDPVTGVLSGTPAQTGTFDVVVTASNGVGSASHGTVVVTVGGPQVTDTSPPAATRGTAYSFQLASTGAAAPVVWKKSSKFPRGLKLSAAGLVSGTPSPKIPAGAYAVKVSLTEVTAVGKLKVVVAVALDPAVSDRGGPARTDAAGQQTVSHSD